MHIIPKSVQLSQFLNLFQKTVILITPKVNILFQKQVTIINYANIKFRRAWIHLEHILASNICKILVKWDIIPKDLEEVYIYGFELLISFVSSTLIIIAVGSVFHKTISSIIFLLIFILVRRFTGGYHANSYLKCKIYTVGTFITILVLAGNVNMNVLTYSSLGIIGLLAITIWGPVENPNKPLTCTERKKHKIIGLIMFELLIICGSIIIPFHQTLSNVIFYSLLSIIALMLYAIIKERRFNYEKEDG